jgi:hypothetical protein
MSSLKYFCGTRSVSAASDSRMLTTVSASISCWRQLTGFFCCWRFWSSASTLSSNSSKLPSTDTSSTLTHRVGWDLVPLRQQKPLPSLPSLSRAPSESLRQASRRSCPPLTREFWTRTLTAPTTPISASNVLSAVSGTVGNSNTNSSNNNLVPSTSGSTAPLAGELEDLNSYSSLHPP